MTTTDHSMQVRTAAGINALLGIWLFVSPWVYGYYAARSGGAWNSWVVGVLILLFAASRYSTPHQRTQLSWFTLILGAWTVISPWVYGYAGNLAALWNSVILGLIVLALSIWSGSATVMEHREEHHAHA
jgi:hypothetical protein